jgi:hypothetical protein
MATLKGIGNGYPKSSAKFIRSSIMADPQLSPEQEAEAQRIAALVGQKVQEETLRIARLLASKGDADLLGKTEFEVRDRVHAIGAQMLETALQGRKKGGTKGPASAVRTARRQRDS